MTFDTQHGFDLAQIWLNARGNPDPAVQAAAAAALQEMQAAGLNPQQTGLATAERRQRLLELERLRLSYHREIADIGKMTMVAPSVSSYLSETAGAYILDTMGTGRRGKGTQSNFLHPHDLVNMVEVKENSRVFPNIHIPLYGSVYVIGGYSWVRVHEKKTHPMFIKQLDGTFARVTAQINNDNRASTLQRVAADNTMSGNVAKTRTGKKQVSMVRKGKLLEWVPSAGRLGAYQEAGDAPLNNTSTLSDGVYIRLGQGQALTTAEEGWFMLLQESGNVNFSHHSGAHHAQTLANGPLFVSRHRDVGGRYCVSFVRIPARPMQAAQGCFLHRPLAESYQWQPYLFADNERTSYKENPPKGNATANCNSVVQLGGMLLAHYVETDTGLEEAFWDQTGIALNGQTARDLLLSDQALGGRKRPMDDGWNTTQKYTKRNRDRALERLLQAMCDINRNMRRFTDETNTARNTWTGKEAEYMACLRFGVRGDRSGAKGIDVFELDGKESEVKQVSGQRGDALFTMDRAPPINNISDVNKKRLYIGRIHCKYKSDARNGDYDVSIKLQYIDVKPTIASHIEEYFNLHPNSPNFQYHVGTYESNTYGSEARKFTPRTDFEYIEGQGFVHRTGRFVRFVFALRDWFR